MVYSNTSLTLRTGKHSPLLITARSSFCFKVLFHRWAMTFHFYIWRCLMLKNYCQVTFLGKDSGSFAYLTMVTMAEEYDWRCWCCNLLSFLSFLWLGLMCDLPHHHILEIPSIFTFASPFPSSPSLLRFLTRSRIHTTRHLQGRSFVHSWFNCLIALASGVWEGGESQYMQG